MKRTKTKPTNRTTPVPNQKQATPATPPPHCAHVMTNGAYCGSPALRGRPYCHFHSIHLARCIRARRKQEVATKFSIDPEYIPMDLPLLEDANSIQLALSHAADALMNHSIDPRRAGLLLYALQTAVLNLNNGVDFSQPPGAVLADQYDDLEKDLDLGGPAPELLNAPPVGAPTLATANGGQETAVGMPQRVSAEGAVSHSRL